MSYFSKPAQIHTCGTTKDTRIQLAPPMKLSRFRPAMLLLACSAGFLHADIVILKDGKRLEGSITAENPQAIHMRYKLTPKIWDDKDIPRTEIAEIIKQKPEEVELIELKKLVPTVDLMTAEKYEALIQDRLRPFVNRYPGTPQAAEAEKMIAQVQEEKEKVVAGGVKLEGKWLTPDEAKAETYNINAYGMRAAMLEKIEAKDYSGALREFEKLYSAQGFASKYFVQAVEEATTVLTKYEAIIEQMIKDQPALQKMRDESLKKLIEPDLSRVKQAIDREMEQWKTTYEQERKVTKWYTPNKYDLSSLKALSQSIITQKNQLKGLNLAVIGKVNAAIARVMQAEPKASKNADELKKMGDAILEGEAAAAGADASTLQFYSSIFQGYRDRYGYANQQLAAQSSATGVPGGTAPAGGSSAIGGTATPGMDDKVAAALAAAAGGGVPAANPAAPGAQPGVPGGAPGAAVAPGTQVAPAPGMVAPAGVPNAVPGAYPTQPGAMPQGAYPAQPGMAPAGGVPPTGYPTQPQAGYGQPQAGYAQQPMAPAPVAAPMPAPAEEEGGGLSTNMLILIGIGVVVIVLVAAMSGGKKKKA